MTESRSKFEEIRIEKLRKLEARRRRSVGSTLRRSHAHRRDHPARAGRKGRHHRNPRSHRRTHSRASRQRQGLLHRPARQDRPHPAFHREEPGRRRLEPDAATRSLGSDRRRRKDRQDQDRRTDDLREKIHFLTKTLAHPPEKYHKATDVELLLRRRYIDMIQNKEVLERFETRAKILRHMRDVPRRPRFH